MVKKIKLLVRKRGSLKMLLKEQLEILAYSKVKVPERTGNVERNKYLAHNGLLRNTW